jgi:RNA methyltransferase, TrmH family
MSPSHGLRGGPRRHRPGDAETYAVGEWPVLEALRHRPRLVRAVLLDPRLSAARRERLTAAARAAGAPWRDDARTVRTLRHRSDARALALLRCERDVLADDRDHVALVAASDPGNRGAVLHTALGFDQRDVALIGSALDPWAPHVLRASQGARFAVRVASFDGWDGYLAAHPGRLVAWLVTPRPGSAEVSTAARLPRPLTLGFGPEWPATDRREWPAGSVAPPVDARHLSIPQHPDLESHNLAVAVGITLYALGR